MSEETVWGKVLKRKKEPWDFNGKTVEEKLDYLARLACSWNAHMITGDDFAYLLWMNIFYGEFTERWKERGWWKQSKAKIETEEMMQAFRFKVDS